jgi:pre-mRNA-splicing factor SPF27
MPPAYEPAFTQLFQQDIERKAAGRPFSGGVDLSRYEAPEEPSDERNIDAWWATLKKAYTSGSYLSGRLANLSLLEEYGKNAWLISNSQLEGLLKQLEMELAEVKQSTENINKARKTAQEGSRAELVGLEETWRRSVGKIIEVQVATDGLRREILARRQLSAR